MKRLALAAVAATTLALATPAQAASLTYNVGTGFSEQVVVMTAPEPLTITNNTPTDVTFVSNSPAPGETTVTIRSQANYTYRFNEQPGVYAITAVDSVTTNPTVTVVVRP